jgi:hypothetical protein
MTFQTPRRSLARPSHLTASSPNLGAVYSSQQPPLPNASTSSQLGPQSGLSASAALARKASLNQLTSNSLASIPDASAGYGLSTVHDEDSSPASMTPTTPAARKTGGGEDGIDLGDAVDVPGGMHGTVRFLGTVKGKKGTFAGVELGREYAQRGKNDGVADG